MKTSNDGANPAMAFATHAPASEKRISLRRPQPVGERDHHERHQHSNSGDGEGQPERLVGLVERVGDCVTVLGEQSATEVGDEGDERQRRQARGLLGRERNRRHDRPSARGRRGIAARDAGAHAGGEMFELGTGAEAGLEPDEPTEEGHRVVPVRLEV